MPDIERPHEEVVNTLTHGAGLLASVVGAAVLLPLAILGGNFWAILGACIYCTSLVLLYASSTIYHAVTCPVAKARFLVLDHCAIFVLIAGSYTPFAFALHGWVGGTLCAVVWLIALAGIVMKLFYAGRFRFLSTAMYVAMGWLALFAAGPIARELHPSIIVWLVLGGITYTAGTYFYLSQMRYAHAVWHIFVLGGSAFHFAAVMSQVLPA